MQTTNKPSNITELRNELIETFSWVKSDPTRVKQAKEMNNSVGKVIATLKIQTEYSVLRGEVPEIAFMGKTSGKKLQYTTKPIKR